MSIALTAIDTAINQLQRQTQRTTNIIVLLKASRQQVLELEESPAADPLPATKGEAPVRKTAVYSSHKGASATRIGEEQIVDAAIGLIRKSGPLTLTTITKGIKKVYPRLKGGIGKALRSEAKKTGCRVARDQSGRWIETADVRRVDDKRSPEEVAAAFARARSNSERQTDAA